MDDKIIDLTKIDLPSNEPRYYKEYEKYANILKKKVIKALAETIKTKIDKNKEFFGVKVL